MRKTLFHHTHFSKIGLLSWTTQHLGDVEGGLMMSWHYEFFEVCKWLEIFHNTKNRVCVCTLNWIFCSELIGAGLRVTIPYPSVYFLLCCDLTWQHNNDRIWASCLDGPVVCSGERTLTIRKMTGWHLWFIWKCYELGSFWIYICKMDRFGITTSKSTSSCPIWHVIMDLGVLDLECGK